MEQMAAIRKRSDTSVIGQIADDLLAWVTSRFSSDESSSQIHNPAGVKVDVLCVAAVQW